VLNEGETGMKADDSRGSALKQLLIIAVMFGAILWLLCLFGTDQINPDQKWKLKHDREMLQLRKEFNGQ
jgi:hypothetical protein